MGEITFKQRLVGDLVAIQPIDPEPATILMPDWQRTLRGKVIAVGPGAPLANGKIAPMSVKVGDFVVFGAAAGMESVYCGEAIRIMRDENIDCVLEEVA